MRRRELEHAGGVVDRDGDRGRRRRRVARPRRRRSELAGDVVVRVDADAPLPRRPAAHRLARAERARLRPLARHARHRRPDQRRRHGTHGLRPVGGRQRRPARARRRRQRRDPRRRRRARRVRRRRRRGDRRRARAQPVGRPAADAGRAPADHRDRRCRPPGVRWHAPVEHGPVGAVPRSRRSSARASATGGSASLDSRRRQPFRSAGAFPGHGSADRMADSSTGSTSSSRWGTGPGTRCSVGAPRPRTAPRRRWPGRSPGGAGSRTTPPRGSPGSPRTWRSTGSASWSGNVATARPAASSTTRSRCAATTSCGAAGAAGAPARGRRAALHRRPVRARDGAGDVLRVGTVKSAAARGLERLRTTLGPSWALEQP